MKWLLFFICSVGLAQTTITGTFKYPDGSLLSGRVLITLTRSTAVDTCAGGQVVNFSPVTVQIAAGVLGSLTLVPTSCLCLKTSATTCVQPSPKYLIKVYDTTNKMLYMGYWNVPNTGSTDVTQLDSN